MKNRSFLFLLFLLPLFQGFSINFYAQVKTNVHIIGNDSIKKRIKQFAKQKQYDSAVLYSRKLLKKSIRIQDTGQIALANFRLGYYHMKQYKLDTAFSHYNKSYKIHLLLKDTISAISRLTSMANIQQRIGEFSGSELTAIDALSLTKNLKDPKRTASIYHIISVALKEQKKISESKKWSDKLMDLLDEEKSKIPSETLIIYNNTRANILAEQKEFKKSILILKTLLLDSLLLSNETEHARVLTNLGRIKWLENRDNLESEAILLDGLEMRKEINSVSGLISSNIHLAKYYQEGNPKRALPYALAALENAQKLKNPISILEALDLIIPLKTKLKVPMQSQANLYIKTRNELTQIQQKIKNIYATTKYDNDQLTQENFMLQAATAKKEKQRVIFLSALVLVFLLAAFLIYYKDQQRKRERIFASQKTEARMSKKIHDELANDVSGVMNFVETQINVQPRKKDELLNFLNSIYVRARDISTQTADIDLDDFATAIKNLIVQHQTPSNTVVTNSITSMDWTGLANHKKIAVYRSIQELLVNTKKHAKATQISIVFKNHGRKWQIIYTDNGIGFNANEKILSGLNNVETRMTHIGGIFSFEAQEGKGFKAKLQF